jgi:hypothetical protein
MTSAFDQATSPSVWTSGTDSGDSIVEHVASVDDFEVAEATYRAAVARWPRARITLRQGARVIEHNRRLRVV